MRRLVVVSDTHCGCQVGLCPPSVTLDGSGVYRHSAMQAIVWEAWNTWWTEWVPRLTEGEEYAVVVNGDALDGRHHRSTTQISQNLQDQRRIAYEVFAPVAEKCEGRLYWIRGTEAHVGPSGEDEEAIAESLQAIPTEHGRHSRHELWCDLDGALVHLTHHIGTTGRTHYETSAVMGELAEMFTDAGRWNRQPPDVVVRSHRHRYVKIEVPTHRVRGIGIVTPGWQLKTPFVHKIPGGRVTEPQIGGIVICKNDDEVYTRHHVWGMERGEVVDLCKA